MGRGCHQPVLAQWTGSLAPGSEPRRANTRKSGGIFSAEAVSKTLRWRCAREVFLGQAGWRLVTHALPLPPQLRLGPLCASNFAKERPDSISIGGRGASLHNHSQWHAPGSAAPRWGCQGTGLSWSVEPAGGPKPPTSSHHSWSCQKGCPTAVAQGRPGSDAPSAELACQCCAESFIQARQQHPAAWELGPGEPPSGGFRRSPPAPPAFAGCDRTQEANGGLPAAAQGQNDLKRGPKRLHRLPRRSFCGCRGAGWLRP